MSNTMNQTTFTLGALKQFTEAPEGYRISRVIAKGGMVEKRKIESQGCILPVVSENALQRIMLHEVGKAWLAGKVEELQDRLVRKLVATNKEITLNAETIGVEQLLLTMRAENESQRFSKESIKVWFDASLKPLIVARLQEKMCAGTAKTAKDTLEKLAAQYLEAFQVLAQRNPTMSNAVKASLVRAMELLPEDHDSVVAVEVMERLNAVTEVSVVLSAL